MWSEAYEVLSEYEKGEFRRFCNYLLSHTYVVRDVYNHEKRRVEANHNYRTISSMFEIMREYFSYSGFKLEKDDDYGVISLVSEFVQNRYRSDRFTTLFLYVCRLIYEEERENSVNQSIVPTDTDTIIQKMRMLNLLDGGKVSQEKRKEAQQSLAHFNIIQKSEPGKWQNEGNRIHILPTVLLVIRNLDDMKHELEEMQIAKTEDDDE